VVYCLVKLLAKSALAICLCVQFIIITIIITIMSLVTGLLSQELLMNQQPSPTLNLQAAILSVLRAMFPVHLPSVLILLNVFLVWIPQFFFTPFVTISVAPDITGVITHFTSHIRCLSINKHSCNCVPFLFPIA